jgi:flagellin
VALNDEITRLMAEIDRIASTTEFNNQKILNGTFKDKKLQIGDKSYQTMDVTVGSVALKDLGMGPNGLSSNTLVSARVDLAAAAAGDIEVNDQALGEIKGTDDIQDIVKNINDHVDNVKASAFNVITAKYAGTGVTTDGQLKIEVEVFGEPDVASTYTSYSISASNSMDELVNNINNQVGGTMKASVNSEGKLVLENTTGATIKVTDTSAGSNASPSFESASGFKASGSGGVTAEFTGFLKIESTNGAPVRIDSGNKALASPGTLDDVASLGFRPITSDANISNDAFTVTGKSLTAAGIDAPWSKTDLTINGVEIWDVDIETNSFQGKLDAINNFAAQTGVQASAYFEESFTIDTTKLIAGNKFRLNGTELTIGASPTVSSMVTLINTKTTETGLVASANGNNLVLTGANVQSVDIQYVNPNTDLHNSLSAAIGAIATDSAAARAVTITTDIAAGGRTYTLSIEGGTYTYASLASDTKTEIAEGLRVAFLSHSTNSAFSGATVTNTDGVLSFGASVGAGVSEVVLSITDTPNPLGSASTHFGAIRLNSVNDQPISIALGDDADVDEHGMLEANVGDGEFGLNKTTFGSESGGSLLGMNISTANAATKAITTIDQAIEKVSSYRSKLGAMENRLNNTVNNLSNIVTNTQASRSRIQDTDYASETTALAKAQIISQAATAMLAQANQQPQSVLSLLK